MYFSGKGGTPLPCLETFHGDEAFSEKVQRECFFPYVVAQSILNFVSTLPGEPGCEELCFEFEKLHSCLPGLPQVWSICLDVDLVYS